MASNQTTNRPIPYVKIIHQPSSVYRMRYKAEKRQTFLFAENASVSNQNELSNASSTSLAAASTSASSSSSSKKTPGARKKTSLLNETPEGTFPRIQIVNGCGPATLIVSCVNKCEPYHIHPHRLNGENCKSGVAVINIGKGDTYFDIAGISIEFTKKSDIEEAITELKAKNVDPFNVGFSFDRNSIDLTQIRLCFQVYLRDSLESNEIIRDQYHILKPVVSQIICNSSRKSTLSIIKSFQMNSPVNGGSTVILFMKKLEKDQKNLKAKFYDDLGWEQLVDISEANIHYQCSAFFEAPAYKNQNLEKDITVKLKVFVPFSSKHEKTEYLKQLEEKEDEEDSMDSASTSGRDSNYSNDIHRESPDGKYESKVLEFVYKPRYLGPLKRKYDSNNFYEFSDQNDRDAMNDIKPQVKKNLAKRQFKLMIESNEENQNIPELFAPINNSQIDSIALNHTIAYSQVIQNNNFNSATNLNNPPNQTTTNDLISIQTSSNNNHEIITLNSFRQKIDETFQNQNNTPLDTPIDTTTETTTTTTTLNENNIISNNYELDMGASEPSLNDLFNTDEFVNYGDFFSDPQNLFNLI